MKTSDQDRIDMVSLYLRGESITTIGKRFNVTPQNVFYILIRRKIKMRTSRNRKYFLQENYFDKIENQEQAYILGFLFADGYNDQKSGQISLNLHEKDKQILIDISKILQPDKPLQYIKYVGKKYDNIMNRSNQFRMVIGSRKISNILAKIGCICNKTYTIRLPKLKNKLIRHFVRGYFDGDGSISKGIRKGNEAITITSNVFFIEDLQDLFANKMGFNKTKLYFRFPDNKKIATLIICGGIQVKRFYNFIYKDATLLLERKKKVFEEIMCPKSQEYIIEKCNCIKK